jgi:hypothetical protein
MTAPRRALPPLVALFVASVSLASCSRKEAPPEAGTGASPSSLAKAPEAPAPIPPDGKYERVLVEGVTVPMINVMNSGSVVLIDTDGQKPRSWEEQYKRKGSLPAGSFDLHKTNANKNDTFEDDPIDREGLWTIDERGNITKR